MLRQGIHGFPKNVSPFGPAVWPALADKYNMSEELYYIDEIQSELI